MPVAPAVSYPGVYIQEVPSDVRSITPVETATTAFIGRARRGPVNRPVICNSYADFQRVCGGLWLESKLGYAVSDFFRNGGSKAVVVRFYNLPPETVEAAENVFGAVKAAANKDEPTVESLVTAAQKKAAEYEEEGAAHDAANAVAKAVEGANVDGATVDSLVTAAQAAVPRPKASLSVTRPKRAALAVFEAVAAVDTKEYDDTIVKKLDKAAKAAADKVKAPKAAAKAAKDAAVAIKKAVDKANENGATVDSLVKAALAAAEAQEGEDTQAAANAVANAVKKAAKDAMLKAAQAALDDHHVIITLEAVHEGAWGNSLRVRLTDVDSTVSEELAKRYGVPEWELFNLSVRDLKTDTDEYFPNVTVVPGPRRLDRVLENESELVRVVSDRVVSDLKTVDTRPAAHDSPADKNWWEDPNACSAVDGEATDGKPLTSTEFLGDEDKKTGLYALEKADIFNLLCIPPYKNSDGDVDTSVLTTAATYCEKRRALLLVDPPTSWSSKDKARTEFPTTFPGSLGNNAAIFFPRIQAPNPLRDNRVEDFPPSGAIAGIFARTDATRGVWKAPAGQEATLRGVVGLSVALTDAENGELNPLGINCLRQLPAAGYVVWGARTTVGDDRLASQWKYISVRRTALYIEESLYRGSQWAVFEPNDEPLWSQLRLNIGVFMHGLFRQGAFQGQSPEEAYFVKCDSSTTTQADIDRGIVNIIVGFAPLKPAEFVVLYIQQMAGQLAT